MNSNSFRDHLALLEKKGKLLRVTKQVDPKYGIAAGIRKVSDNNGPALLFENIIGYPRWRVLGGLFATRELTALALGTEPTHRAMTQKYLDCWDKRVKPVIVPTGPVKQVIIRANDVDLTRLPVPTYCQWDAGPYLTAGVEIARHPETGIQNVSIHRRMILGKDRTSLFANPPQHLSYMAQAAQEQGKGLGVATAIGVPPALTIASQFKVPFGVDETDIAGALQGRPLELVKCETIDAFVPADAEIVIEGVIIPGERVDDGPFGEYPGNYISMDNFITASGTGISQSRVVQVTAITMREDAIFQAMLTGMPVTENHCLCEWALQAACYRVASSVTPSRDDVREVNLPDAAGSHPHVVVSIHKRVEATPRNVINAILAAGLNVQRVVVVDEDIDVYDQNQVEWAIASRVRPDKDIIIFQSLAPKPGSTSKSMIDAYKWGIDATAPITDQSWQYRRAIPPGVDLVDYV